MRVGLASRWLVPLVAVCTAAWAGPPFQTDDPEPVELHHWEVYVGSQYFNGGGVSATIPHVEVNYGALPELQLHLLAPFGYSKPPGQPAHVGPGDLDLGAKYRFLRETRTQPQVGVFPHVFLPTGNARYGLGYGHPQLQLPVWAQKSWGPWTTYGGGGVQFNTGRGSRTSWLAGWEVQRDLGSHLTLGGELYYATSPVTGGPDSFSFNLGGQYNIDDGHHLLFSAGRGFSGPNKFSAYVAFQWTFGPR